MDASGQAPPAVIQRLYDAVQRRDLDALMACFDESYRSEQPLHPDAPPRDRAHVETTWSRPLRDVRDLQVDLLSWIAGDTTIWTEWRWRGTWANGTLFDIAGVMIFGVAEDRLTWGRLYMEPVHGPHADGLL
jgi:ketosteroid isomerase-like protein